MVLMRFLILLMGACWMMSASRAEGLLGTKGLPYRPYTLSPYDSGYAIEDAWPMIFFGDETVAAIKTLFADESSQTGSAALEWRADASPPSARGEIAGEDGVRYRRTVFFDPPRVVLLDEYDSDTPHRFGWIFHAYGKLMPDTPLGDDLKELGMPELPSDKAFSLLTERKSGVVQGEFTANYTVSKKVRLKLLTVSDGPLEATCAVTPGQPLPDKQGAVVFRAPGKTRKIATVLEPYLTKPTTTAISLTDEIVTVTGTDGSARRYGER